MARIGVVTFHSTIDNYGQVLQYLATQEFLRQRSHEVSLLDIVKKKRCGFALLFFKLKRKIKSFFSDEKSNNVVLSKLDVEKRCFFDECAKVSEKLEEVHPRFFSQFREDYFKQSYLLADDVGKCFDVYAVGSDQTWSSVAPVFFGVGVSREVKKITIAPSVGHKVFSEQDIKKVRPWLSSFELVTVREDSGVDMCRRAGYRRAVKVLDPTFLCAKEDYSAYEEDIAIEKPYVLLYLLGSEISLKVVDIIDFASKNGLSVKYVGSQGRSDAFINVYPKVGQWLSLIKNAEYVVTNSFHGMAFSIIYRKQFLVLPIIGLLSGMNERVYDLAKVLNLESRIFKDDLAELFNKVDYDIPSKIIDENRCEFSKMLESVNL